MLTRRSLLQTTGLLPFAARLLPAGILPGSITAPLKTGSVDEYLSRLVPFGFSGVIAIAQGDTVQLEKGYGVADRKHNRPMTKDTVISVGSITKQFTAAAILKLEMAGKLSTADPIAKHLPGVPAGKRAVTIHHLLTHTAGLRSDYGETDYDPVSREEYIRRAMSAPLVYEPGALYQYANSGYSLAAAIVELVSGQSYERFCRDHLFLPAGMTRTGYLLPAYKPEELAVGYRGGEEWGTILSRPMASDGPYWVLRGNGGIHSTAGDMIRWHLALKGNRILSAEARQKYQAGFVKEDGPGGTSYAYGWSVGDSPHGRLVEHNGGNGIFAADFLRYTDADVVLYIASNIAEWSAIRFSHPMARLAFGDDLPLPPKTVAVPPEKLGARAGVYKLPSGAKVTFSVGTGKLIASGDGLEAIMLLLTGAAAAGPRSAELTARAVEMLSKASQGDVEDYIKAQGPDASPERIRANQQRLWAGLRERLGELKNISAVATLPRPAGASTHVRVVGERGAELIEVMWSPEGEVVGLRTGGQLPQTEFLPASADEFVRFDTRSLRPITVRFGDGWVEFDGGVRATRT